MVTLFVPRWTAWPIAATLPRMREDREPTPNPPAPAAEARASGERAPVSKLYEWTAAVVLMVLLSAIVVGVVLFLRSV